MTDSSSRPETAPAAAAAARPEHAGYRGFVGPAVRYDFMGATQLSLLFALGLRGHHRLLDIGCGSLRAGRLFIAYLDDGGYTGLEPNAWLVEEALAEQIGRDVLHIKHPTFVHNEVFDVRGLGQFDFVVAQSVASHTGPAMTGDLLQAVHDALAPRGLAAITFVPGWHDSTQEGWVYFDPPHVTRYRRSTVHRFLAEAGLHGAPLPWFHPGGQRWWVIARRDTPLPPARVRRELRGTTLAHRHSLGPWPTARRWGRALARRLPRPRPDERPGPASPTTPDVDPVTPSDPGRVRRPGADAGA